MKVRNKVEYNFIVSESGKLSSANIEPDNTHGNWTLTEV